MDVGNKYKFNLHVYVSFIYFLLSEMGSQNVSNSQNKKTGCCCGLMSKSRGLTDIASYMESDKSRCSCLRNQETCTRLCRCINCNNQGLQEKGAVSKRKGCTCGSLNKVKAKRVSCKDHVEMSLSTRWSKMR